eukprot:gene26918-4541_t
MSQGGTLLSTLTHHSPTTSSGTLLSTLTHDSPTTPSGTLLSTLTHHSDYVKCVAASPVRNVAASAGLRGEIFLTGSTVHLYPTKAGGSQVSPNDSGVGAVGGIACFAANPQQQQSSTEPKGSIYSLAMQATGGLLAAGSTDHAVRLWDPRTFTKVGKLRGHTDLVRTLLIKEDGTQLLSGSSDSTIKLLLRPTMTLLVIFAKMTNL